MSKECLRKANRITGQAIAPSWRAGWKHSVWARHQQSPLTARVYKVCRQFCLLRIFSEWCQWLINKVMSGYWTITSQKYDVCKEMPKPDTKVLGPADGTGRTKHG